MNMVDTAANCHTNLVIGGATNSFTIKLVDSTSTNPLNENAAANGLIAFDSANDPITGSTFAVSIHTTVGLLNVLRDAAAIAESNAPLVLAPTAFTNAFIFEKANSMGLKSGLYPGNNTNSHPLASIASRTSGLRCTPQLIHHHDLPRPQLRSDDLLDG